MHASKRLFVADIIKQHFNVLSSSFSIPVPAVSRIRSWDPKAPFFSVFGHIPFLSSLSLFIPVSFAFLSLMGFYSSHLRLFFSIFCPMSQTLKLSLMYSFFILSSLVTPGANFNIQLHFFEKIYRKFGSNVFASPLLVEI